MKTISLILVFASAVVIARPEPPVDEPLEGPVHYPEALPLVRDLLVYDTQPGSPSSGQYGAPGGPGGSGTRGQPKDVIIADPELAPLLSTFELSPTVEKRTGSAGPGGPGTGSGSGLGVPNQGYEPFGAGRSQGSAGGYN